MDNYKNDKMESINTQMNKKIEHYYNKYSGGRFKPRNIYTAYGPQWYTWRPKYYGSFPYWSDRVVAVTNPFTPPVIPSSFFYEKYKNLNTKNVKEPTLIEWTIVIVGIIAVFSLSTHYTF